MTTVINTLAQFFGLLGHGYFFPALMVLGLFTKHRKDILRLVPLICITLFLNYALKQYFQKPLPAWMNTSNYAFPSGHMQSAAVFWGWVYLHTKQWRLAQRVLPIILLGIGWQMIHRGFHDIVDVAGGAVVGAALLAGYFYALNHSVLGKHLSKAYATAVLFALGVYAFVPGVDTALLVVLGITATIGTGWYLKYDRGMCACTKRKAHG